MFDSKTRESSRFTYISCKYHPKFFSAQVHILNISQIMLYLFNYIDKTNITSKIGGEKYLALKFKIDAWECFGTRAHMKLLKHCDIKKVFTFRAIKSWALFTA